MVDDKNRNDNGIKNRYLKIIYHNHLRRPKIDLKPGNIIFQVASTFDKNNSIQPSGYSVMDLFGLGRLEGEKEIVRF